MKKFEKPFIKIVVLEEVLVCSTSIAGPVTGQGVSKGGGIKWDNQSNDNDN